MLRFGEEIMLLLLDDRLVERGILERREDRFLWVFRSRRYPVIDGKAEREVKLRIMEEACNAPHRTDPQDGPDRPRRHRGDPGHRGLTRAGDSAAHGVAARRLTAQI